MRHNRLLAVLLSCAIRAADYEDGLAPPGEPASAFPAPGRPVAGIVTGVLNGSGAIRVAYYKGVTSAEVDGVYGEAKNFELLARNEAEG